MPHIRITVMVEQGGREPGSSSFELITPAGPDLPQRMADAYYRAFRAMWDKGRPLPASQQAEKSDG